MARPKSRNVGVIGLGIIGSRIAGALRKRGLQVFVWNRTPRPEQNFVGSPAEVAQLCDVVQIFVADDEALLEMVRQLSPSLAVQHIITAHCTVSPESMRAAADIVQRRGARFLDAPFTGSKIAAENGQLTYYIGGDEAALKRVQPILEASSKEIVMISERIGDASIVKVATNMVTAATAEVAAEALALVGKAGIAPELFTRAMKSNASNSATLEMKVPLMIAGDFEPHFSVKHMLKDVLIGMRLAQEYGLHLPLTEVSGDMLLAEVKQGRGDADYSSVAQRYFPAPPKVVRQEPAKIAEPPKPPDLIVEKNEATDAKPAEVVATKAAEPVQEAKPAEPSPDTNQEKTAGAELKEEEFPEGVNLSGGIRGWIRRFGSSSRHES
ncbi:MAG: NAD(P)-dependent oxidoreductase [Chthoniobacterales bacterium]